MPVIMHALREVAAGRHYLSALLSPYMLEAYIQKAKGVALDSYATLTSCEREVRHLETSPAIAAMPGLSPRTVKTHCTNLMRKIGLRTQTDRIRYALQRGLISLHS